MPCSAKNDNGIKGKNDNGKRICSTQRSDYFRKLPVCDKELEKRKLHAVRYADDFLLFVRSKRAAARVMQSVSGFVTSKRGDTRIRIHSKSIQRFKNRVREFTDRNSGKSIHQIVYDMNLYLRGWWNYYWLTQSTSRIRSMHGWIMRRLRAILWKQWKNPRTRVRELRRRRISHRLAVRVLAMPAKAPGE